MATAYLPSSWRDLTDGAEYVEVGGSTLRDVIAELDQRFPGIAGRIRTADGIIPGLAVSVDGNVTSRGLLAKVEADSEIHFLPAIGGG